MSGTVLKPFHALDIKEKMFIKNGGRELWAPAYRNKAEEGVGRLGRGDVRLGRDVGDRESSKVA